MFLLLLALLLVPAAALTGARLAEPDQGAGVQLVSFTPFGLVLYVVAVLLLAAGLWRSHGAMRGLYGTLLVAGLAGVVLHGWWLLPAYANEPDPPRKGARELRVMSLNLEKGQADPVRVLELATANRVDVLALQEVDEAALGALRRAGIRARFPTRAGKPAPGVAGTVVFARGPVRDVSRLDTRLGGWSMSLPRGVRLVVVHAWPPTGDATDWRRDQNAIRAAAVAAARGGDALVVGDFNATLDHRPMRELGGRGLRDAATVAGAGWQPTWPADTPVLARVTVPSLLAIDHVLVEKAFDVVRVETATVPGTDHRALVAILAR